MPKAMVKKFSLDRDKRRYPACMAFSNATIAELRNDMKDYLSVPERTQFREYKFEKRQFTYLIGRYCAKIAVGALIGADRLREIVLDRGVFDQPIVRYTTDLNPQVSISHCEQWGCALAFFEEHPMGIDIERIDGRRIDVIKTQLTADELAKLEGLPINDDERHALIWTAKEALSKTIRCGMMTPFKIYEVAGVDFHNSATTCTFTNFAQYKTRSFRFSDFVVSAALPKKSEMRPDILVLRNDLDTMADRDSSKTSE